MMMMMMIMAFIIITLFLLKVLRVSSGVTNISIDADEKEIVFHIISICPSVGETTSSQHAG